MANKPIPPETLKVYAERAKEIEARTGSLTVAACMTAFGYNSSSATVYAMKKMAALGYLTAFPRGKYTTYRVTQ